MPRSGGVRQDLGIAPHLLREITAQLLFEARLLLARPFAGDAVLGPELTQGLGGLAQQPLGQNLVLPL